LPLRQADDILISESSEKRGPGMANGKGGFKNVHYTAKQ
jgi:hypothetical protein